MLVGVSSFANLSTKLNGQGVLIAEVDRFFPSSKHCSCCGFIHEAMPLNIRDLTCPECSTHHDRGINAAKNIRTVGLARFVLGATGSGIAS
ncbi:zinc ribbon domain-containing protein [Candidatus Enterovibrio escicola]|uniref:zinc ribbon domain-containing protein n=1 Tax=Candidatus Enterovibrio escicola TaxID=1927127 RepID=UPI001CC24543